MTLECAKTEAARRTTVLGTTHRVIRRGIYSDNPDAYMVTDRPHSDNRFTEFAVFEPETASSTDEFDTPLLCPDCGDETENGKRCAGCMSAHSARS